MGRHSRRGTEKDTAQGEAAHNTEGREAAPGGARRDRAEGASPHPGARVPDGASRGARLPEGAAATAVPRPPDGSPARVAAHLPDGTAVHGAPRLPGGAPGVRGGHPEQREPGGGWGEPPARGGAAGPAIPGQRPASAREPRQDYVEAFDGDDDDVFAPRVRTTVTRSPEPGLGDDEPPTGVPAQGAGGKGRAFAGVAAAAVTTVLAVVVAGQAADREEGGGAGSRSVAGTQDGRDSASRGDGRPTPSTSPSVVALTYAQKMSMKYPLSATLDATGKFDAIPGTVEAPGKGEKFTYRVDVEKGLGLDGELFAEAVQKTLNDDRSWAHDDARTFERVSSGDPDFVVTLASPGTTAYWCEKSGLDTTVDNVSCDSVFTDRVMINAYRWAQGAETYGDAIHSYRQMLINHEVGHRLGYSHVTCDKDGDLAPVMQQQTKFLDHDGIHCRPNAWAYPGS
ncbi:DUF3152 domain-containing protein [Streptomyces sp. NPDC091279]|uniref:DUF3152 domain-containing protein n=1 Tax=Streptomyces sp. NPDC091279 TaxID=3365983 RepID=UPI0037FE9BF6